ncbi:MAG: hypothetical protein IJU20_02010 [Clostridia bacterium]|nr:hypothetical protein [Clostridia bacterium]
MSLILALAVVVGMLSLFGCGEKQDALDEVADSASESAMTLTMYLVTKEETTPEAEKLVSDAINKITKSEFKTQMKVLFYTEDEYYEVLDAKLQQNEDIQKAKEEAKKNKDKDKTQTEKATESGAETAEETETNEYGIVVTKYPPVEDYQVDIMFLGTLGSTSGYDKYLKYIDNGWLASLNTEINGASKVLKSYVSTALLSAVQYNGINYAIPNNNPIGTYTYMLVNKDLYDKTYHSAEIGNVKTVMDLSDFLKDVKTLYPDVLPIASTYEDCMKDLAFYWDIAISDYGDGTDTVINGQKHHSYNVTGDFSIIGYAYEDLSQISRSKVVLEYNALLSTSQTYRDNFLTLSEYNFEGYFGEEEEGKQVAVKFIEGSATEAAAYEDDYYVVTVGYPHVQQQDVYDNMFAVSNYTSSVSRSMEIVTYLNTNEEFRNLLQYGIPDVHYTVHEGQVTRLNHDYMMNIAQTGNCFIAYPEEGMDPGVWDVAKAQNRVAVLDPLYGFIMDNELTWEDPDPEDADHPYGTYTALREDLIEEISKLSKQFLSELNACQSYEEVEDLVTAWRWKLSTGAKNTDSAVKAIIEEYTATSSIVEGDEEETDENGDPVPKETESDTTQFDEQGNIIIVQTVKYMTPFEVYYNWLSKYNYIPAGWVASS